MKKRVVIITDCVDVALLEVRGAIITNAGNADFEIEPVVQVENYNITNTAFLVKLIANMYPPENTIINVIVNPVQERTERVLGRTENNIIFEGTNTGCFGWLLEEYGCAELYELFDPGFIPFGGKYVHAPAVGKILSGDSLSNLGTPFSREKIRDVKRDNGTVLHVDNFGNVKFIGDLVNAQNGDRYDVMVKGNTYQAIYWERMMNRNDGELVIYPGSSFAFPELGIVRGNAAKYMDIRPGDTIEYRLC